MQHPVMLTPEQVRDFHENGYLVIRQVVPPHLIDKVRDGAERLEAQYATYREEKDVYYSTMEAMSFEKMLKGSAASEGSAESRLWRIDDLDEKLPEVKELKRLSFVHNSMEALLGDEFLQYNEAFVVKLARVGLPVPWHQDPSFKIKKVPDPIVTCDIYLDESDEENGCLWVVPGSQKRGVADTDALMEKYGFDLPGAVPVRMQPGDVAFHDNGTIHGSRTNTSERRRRIVYLAFQTLRQARASGAFTEEFIQQRRTAFKRFRDEAALRVG